MWYNKLRNSRLKAVRVKSKFSLHRSSRYQLAVVTFSLLICPNSWQRSEWGFKEAERALKNALIWSIFSLLEQWLFTSFCFTHISLFPGVFLLLLGWWCNDSSLSQKSKYTHNCPYSTGCCGDQPWCALNYIIYINRPHLRAAYVAEVMLLLCSQKATTPPVKSTK